MNPLIILLLKLKLQPEAGTGYVGAIFYPQPYIKNNGF